MVSTVIKTESLSKEFGTNGVPIQIINKLDLEINRGEFTVIMGNSGSGKSTLLFLLAGLDKISSGMIWIDGEPVHNRTEKDLALLRRSHVGFVFQDSNLVPNLSIKENILVAGYLSNTDRNLINARAEALMSELEVSDLASRLPSQVSGGQLQRASIARALINQPVILMADEPTGNLNSESSEKVLDCFDKLAQNGQTIIMVTHDIKSACRGNRVIFLKDGKAVDSYSINQQLSQVENEGLLFQWLKQRSW